MTETFSPFGDLDRKIMWQVLAMWVEKETLPGSDTARAIRAEFRPVRADALRNQLPRSQHPLRLHDLGGWIIGSPLTRQDGVFPVVTFRAGGGVDAVKDAAFRVALIRSLEGGLEASGWRFEQAESFEIVNGEAEEVHEGSHVSAHPYAHAQGIIGWDKEVNCLIHASHQETDSCTGRIVAKHHLVDAERARVQGHVLVKHPAFPLGVRTLTGLALSVFTTLYGARRARHVFGGYRQLVTSTGALRLDLEALSVLDP